MKFSNVMDHRSKTRNKPQPYVGCRFDLATAPVCAWCSIDGLLTMYTVVNCWPEEPRFSSRDVEMPQMLGAAPLSDPLGASY